MSPQRTKKAKEAKEAKEARRGDEARGHRMSPDTLRRLRLEAIESAYKSKSTLVVFVMLSNLTLGSLLFLNTLGVIRLGRKPEDSTDGTPPGDAPPSGPTSPGQGQTPGDTPPDADPGSGSGSGPSSGSGSDAAAKTLNKPSIVVMSSLSGGLLLMGLYAAYNHMRGRAFDQWYFHRTFYFFTLPALFALFGILAQTFLEPGNTGINVIVATIFYALAALAVFLGLARHVFLKSFTDDTRKAVEEVTNKGAHVGMFKLSKGEWVNLYKHANGEIRDVLDRLYQITDEGKYREVRKLRTEEGDEV